MNIYLHCEITIRELDSKLLLAVKAAARGHNVVICEINEFMRGLKSKSIRPGIFHTKSLTPSDDKISIHQTVIDNDFVITSIDEEGGIVDPGYERFAKIRYSEHTLNQSSAAYGWGPEDVNTLKKFYPKFTSKIHMTGSPRADLWSPIFSDYWGIPPNAPKKPYLLISSNINWANNIKPLHETLNTQRNLGYHKRDPEMFRKRIKSMSDDYLKLDAYIEAIKHLAKNKKGYDIVLRPHPVENLEAWKIYLHGIPNVHVIRDGSITPWINNAFAVMHNSCTTAIETTFIGKPLVTYVPFKMVHDWEIPNKLGYKVESLDELSNTLNSIFDNEKLSTQTSHKQIPEILSTKIFLDEKELATDKIIRIWENLENAKLNNSSNLFIFKCHLKAMKLRSFFGSILRGLYPQKFGRNKKNWKYPILNKKDIQQRIVKLQKILKLEKKVTCKFLSDRTFLIS